MTTSRQPSILTSYNTSLRRSAQDLFCSAWYMIKLLDALYSLKQSGVAPCNDLLRIHVASLSTSPRGMLSFRERQSDQSEGASIGARFFQSSYASSSEL